MVQMIENLNSSLYVTEWVVKQNFNNGGTFGETVLLV